ncbi:PAS domain S-box-containing protein [Parelusimicrobium proximum]|uniref:ATP-binding protein n=1 Tax=Parelusimicrobium proximum TaxID=3228953 RepID=UPI003D1827E0
MISKIKNYFVDLTDKVSKKLGLGMRAKLIIIFLVVKIIPLIILAVIAWRQIVFLGTSLREIAVSDSTAALNTIATENIERLTTDAARNVAAFLYKRDSDILYLASLTPSQEIYSKFIEKEKSKVVVKGVWKLSEDGKEWVDTEQLPPPPGDPNRSTNSENNDMDGFNYRNPDQFDFQNISLYDEITYIDLEGNEVIKVTPSYSAKKHFPVSKTKKNVSKRENTYVKAETYFSELKKLKPGEIYVSDVIGVYTPSNYIGMYTPENVAKAAEQRGYPIEYKPEEQAYSGMENPNGRRFEGIVRWASPVTDSNGKITGYVTMALNHDHIMEFVDHINPMNERYTELPNAYEGNYAFIWDYKGRSICHPRHHSIYGFDAATGEPQIPWLEESIYNGWLASGIKKWTDYVKGKPEFDHQSRTKKPAPELTKRGLVGLDCRYLNNAPQCTGWMDLTKDGGSGSFYILWSGLYKLTTAAAIPYYTGQYAPSEANGYSKRGFAFVAIGAGLEDFTRPARETEEKLSTTIAGNLTHTFWQLLVTTVLLIIVVVFVAIWIAWSIMENITKLIKGVSLFRSGHRQFRFGKTLKDEFGTLAESFDDMADSIVDSVKSPLSITDINLRIIYMNDQALKFVGYTLDQVVGKSYTETSVYPANSKYCPITAFKEGKSEAEIYHVPGMDRYIKGSASLFLNKNGKKIGYMIVTTDVTEMVLERNKISEQKALLDKVFSASPDLMWYTDFEGKYLTVNPRFADITGKSPEDFVGRTAKEMLPAGIAAEFMEQDRKAIAAGQPLYTEEKIKFFDNHEETLDSVRTPIYDSIGNIVGLLGFARNVTARVKIESELRNTQINLEQAVNDANRANEHKGEFLARMSHEIRTPMNAIIGLTNIVQNKLGTDKCVADSELDDIKIKMGQIESSSQHLLGLLNDILDISKIEAGKIELTEDSTDLNRLLSTVAAIIKPRCEEKNINFDVRVDAFNPSSFTTDPLRLRQVLINLLGNAVKFTPELGSIVFAVNKLEHKDGKDLIRFSVKDNGIGIAKEALEQIFKPFEQGGGMVSQKYGGTGLGLAISERIVALFGGHIEVVSELGKGSDFTFQIWLKEDEDTAAETEVSEKNIENRFKGKKALLVDDVEINRMIVNALLEPTGIEIDEADDGEKAVEMFKNSPEGTYDLILMDIQMPNMDGYEATSAIRKLDRKDASKVVIVALTANAFKEDIDKAAAHGMNDHITKPVEIERLSEILFKYLG